MLPGSMEKAGSAGVTKIVLVHDPRVPATVIKEMAYGAVVRYNWGGIDFEEMLGDEDYEVLFDLDEVIKEMDENE
jgi:hypothetical protein